jgi:hypothetical protein
MTNSKFFKPIIIVIQGDCRINTTTKKEESLKDLKRAMIPFDLLWYSENSDRIEKYQHRMRKANFNIE